MANGTAGGTVGGKPPSIRNRFRRGAGPPREEAEDWVALGLITPAQRDAILALYPTAAEGRRDRAVLIFSILGSILVAAGVILYFAANWPLLPAWAKVTAIFSAILLTYWGGFRLGYSPGAYPVLGKSLVFLGALFYGAGIWLVAQIFHLQSNFPSGFLLWGLGILPVAWVVSSAPILYAATVCLTIWMFSELPAVSLLNYLYPVLLLGVVMPLARRLRAALAEVLVVVGFFLWFAASAGRLLEIGGPREMATGGLVVFAPLAMLYGVLLWAGGAAEWGPQRVYLGVGAAFTLVGCYALSFNYPAPVSQLLGGGAGAAGGAATSSSSLSALPPLLRGTPFLTAGVILILAGTAAATRLAWKRGRWGRGAGGWSVMAVSVLVPVVAALTAHLWGTIPRAVVFNLLLFAGTVGLITVGVQRRAEAILNLGLLSFAIHAITRYTDLFFRAIDRALFFILGGLLLLGGGWLIERSRRRLTKEWEEGGESSYVP